MHASSHQHVVVPPDRFVFDGMVLVYARWQTFDYSRPFWADEVRYGVAGPGHTLVACEVVLFRRKGNAMDARLECI